MGVQFRHVLVVHNDIVHKKCTGCGNGIVLTVVRVKIATFIFRKHPIPRRLSWGVGTHDHARCKALFGVLCTFAFGWFRKLIAMRLYEWWSMGQDITFSCDHSRDGETTAKRVRCKQSAVNLLGNGLTWSQRSHFILIVNTRAHALFMQRARVVAPRSPRNTSKPRKKVQRYVCFHIRKPSQWTEFRQVHTRTANSIAQAAFQGVVEDGRIN